MYEEKIFITSNDVDSHFDLKVSTIFKYMQQVATNHAEILGVGKPFTDSHNLFWVIIRMKVVIYRLPKMLETLRVTTHPGDNLLYFYPRFFEIYDENDNLVIAGSSNWALLDHDTHKIKVNPFEGKTPLVGEKLNEDLPLPEKVNCDSLNKVETRTVRYSDIDLNGHLNNTKYIDYILDTHDIHFYDKYQVQEILINYEKEIIDGNQVDIYSNNELPEIIAGDVNGTRSFIAKITYQNRNN